MDFYNYHYFHGETCPQLEWQYFDMIQHDWLMLLVDTVHYVNLPPQQLEMKKQNLIHHCSQFIQYLRITDHN